MENWIDTVAAICSAVAAIASVVVAIVIWRAQSKQEKRAQQIALFDKRYEIYQTALKFYRIASMTPEKRKGDSVPGYLLLASIFIEEYGLIEENYLAERNRLLYVIENSDRDTSHKADMDFAMLDYHANLKLLQLKERLLCEIQPSRFCFSEKIYAEIYLLVGELFDYIMIIRNGTAKEDDRDDSALRRRVQLMRDEKIIEQMEEYLSIAK